MALSVKRQEHNRSLHTHTHTHTHTHRGGEDFLLKKQDGKDQEGRKEIYSRHNRMRREMARRREKRGYAEKGLSELLYRGSELF
jgi:hypothetical protein